MGARRNVERLLRADTWTLAEVERDCGIAMLRFRTPVLGGSGPAPGSHRHYVAVCWPYADEGSGELPGEGPSEAMSTFEDRLCGAVEPDALAALAVVLTFDGARQWVYYTDDVDEFARRLGAMPHDGDARYPVELTTGPDMTWARLHQLLAPIAHLLTS